MLTRRKFIKSMALLGVIPFMPNIVKSKLSPTDGLPTTAEINAAKNLLLKGEVGRIEGFRFVGVTDEDWGYMTGNRLFYTDTAKVNFGEIPNRTKKRYRQREKHEAERFKVLRKKFG